MEHSNKTILETVFKVLNDSGLDYCVQNKYEMMPEEIPSDIDMFYRGVSEADLDKIVVEISKKLDISVCQKTSMGYFGFVYMLSPLNPKKKFQLQLDFQLEFSPRQFTHVYLPDSMLNNKQFYNFFYIPSFDDEIVYTIIRRVVKNDFNKDHLKKICYLYSKDIKGITNKLRENLPSEVCEIIIKLMVSNDVSFFNENYAVLHKYCKELSIKNSTWKKRISQRYFDVKVQISRRFINPMGLTVAFISPDGGGKSTVINLIKETCSGVFHGVEEKYFRPRLFKNPGSYNLINPTEEISNNPDPHSRPVNSGFKSFIRYFFYNLDFLLGHVFIIIPHKLKRRLVIYDRYYYDYYVDMKRYQYKLPKFVPRLFSFMIPTPDLVFILDAPADVIYSRKKELSLNEIERQRVIFSKMSKQIKNAYLINTDRPIENVVKEVTELIIKKKVAQTLKKLTIEK